MEVSPEKVKKFRAFLSNKGLEKTSEEAEYILTSLVGFVKTMKNTSQEDIWKVMEKYKRLMPDMTDEESKEFVDLLYQAKEL